MKIYFNKEISNKMNTSGFEFQFCCHLLNPNNFRQSRYLPVKNEGLYHITYDTAEEADYHLMPYKYDENNIYNTIIIEEAKKYNKNLIISYIDDKQLNINIENSIVMLANIDIDKMKENYLCIPCYPSKDYYEFKITNNISIGFDGQVYNPILRKNVCELLKNTKIKCDFKYREIFHYFHNQIDMTKQHDNYVDNMYKNIFNLAIRGAGNFSYRLCEIMSFGRIPIIIRTNNVLPLEHIIDWNSCAVICDENEINLLEEKINYFIYNNNLVNIQKNNRNIWEEYLSPLGFTKNFKTILKQF
jgi:hypothetical protein